MTSWKSKFSHDEVIGFTYSDSTKFSVIRSIWDWQVPCNVDCMHVKFNDRQLVTTLCHSQRTHSVGFYSQKIWFSAHSGPLLHGGEWGKFSGRDSGEFYYGLMG